MALRTIALTDGRALLDTWAEDVRPGPRMDAAPARQPPR